MNRHDIKYYGYRYLNREHVWLERRMIGFSSWVFCKLLLVPKSVSDHILVEVERDEFKLVFRRLAWLLANSWLGLVFIKDNYFDFSIGLDYPAALAAYELVSKRGNIAGDFLYEITLAQLASGVLESQVSPGEEFSLESIISPEFDEKFLQHIHAAKQYLLDDDDGEVESRASVSRSVAEKLTDTRSGLLMIHAEKIFKDLMRVIDRNHLKTFVISGTFLGLIRDDGFIEHDYDIDLGVFELDYDESFESILESLEGFKKPNFDYPCYRKVSADGVVSYSRMSKPALVKLMHKTGVQVDFFVHFFEGDVCWHGSTMHRWDNTTFDLVKRDLLGIAVESPRDYELYLRENYGDWRIPVKDFNCSTGTPNLVDAGTSKSLCLMLKREHYG